MQPKQYLKTMNKQEFLSISCYLSDLETVPQFYNGLARLKLHAMAESSAFMMGAGSMASITFSAGQIPFLCFIVSDLSNHNKYLALQ